MIKMVLRSSPSNLFQAPSIYQGLGASRSGAGLLIDPTVQEVCRIQLTCPIQLTNKHAQSDFRRIGPALASSSALQFLRTLLCPETQTSETLKHPERRSTQRRHSYNSVNL